MYGWTDAARTLPREREYVRFVVVGQQCSMMGVYQRHRFESRSGIYDAGTVEIWRTLGDASQTPQPLRGRRSRRHGFHRAADSP